MYEKFNQDLTFEVERKCNLKKSFTNKLILHPDPDVSNTAF